MQNLYFEIIVIEACRMTSLPSAEFEEFSSAEFAEFAILEFMANLLLASPRGSILLNALFIVWEITIYDCTRVSHWIFHSDDSVRWAPLFDEYYINM